MRRRSRTGPRIKISTILKLAFILIPFLLGGLYVWGAIYIIEDVTAPMLEQQYDPASFIAPNFTLMAQWADQLEYRFEQYHCPTGISLKCTFDDYSYTTVDRYHDTDNVALSTGLALATECFRYAAGKRENNLTIQANATRVIKKLLTGFSYLLAVPNGGIGPDYPGTISRFYWSPNDTSIPGYQHVTDWMLSDHVRHFNGTGEYSNWRWRGYTSKDEMAGYLYGLGAAIQFVGEDDPWIWNRTRLLVAQLIEGFIDTNWLVMNGNGNPVGSDLKAYVQTGEWALSLLRIGKTAFPDGRYDQLYHYFASKDMYMNSVARADTLNLIMDYYGWNFGHKALFNLITLEDNPTLKSFYVQQYINGMYSKLRYTRSPYFNMMYLVFIGSNDSAIKADIFDQLMRFENNSFCRNVNSTLRSPAAELNPQVLYWRDFISNNPLGMLYSPLIELEVDLLTPDGRDLYLEPATVDMMYHNPGNFYESNPFEATGSNRASNNGLSEGPGNTFTCVYWMGRAHGIIPPP